MRHSDPWVFGMLWDIEHREELGRLAKVQLARQASACQAAGWSETGGRRSWALLGRLISGLTRSAWLRLRHPAAKAS